jgi:hypothetical protein
MSYLSGPRLHFNGFFQADVSTINNDVRFYDVEHFKPQYQLPDSSGVSPNGSWQPEGTGIFRLIDCTVTGGWLDGAAIGADPVLGMSLENSDQRVSGKLVDLDPQQQLVSEIWGMSLRLRDDRNPAYFTGRYAVAAFTNAWTRQKDDSAPNDQKIGAAYQSVLEHVVWSDAGGSRLLRALREASEDGLLSIQFNVYGYGRDAATPRYTLGRITGTIGPAGAAEPRRFVLGRQMMPKLGPNPTVPLQGVNAFQCLVDPGRHTVTADFGNALQTENASGVPLVDIGELSLAVLKGSQVDDGAQVGADAIEILGRIPYRQPTWYPATAGIETFDYTANAWVRENIAGHPLVVVKTVDARTWQVLIQESLGGLYARSDQFVYRLNPGESAEMRFYATRYGSPIAAKLALAENDNLIGGAGSQDIPDVPIPDVGLPLTALKYSTEVETHADGSAVLVPVSADPAGPGNPRGYIDGQVYGIGYQIVDPPLPAGYNASPWNFVSVLLFDLQPVPATPTWYGDIQPVLTQFGNLYPIMSRHLVDLGDYDSVVRHADILHLAFSLPVADPNYMPVTRDLSAGRRATLLKWLENPGEDGLPLKGEPALAAAAPKVLYQDSAVPQLDLEPIQRGGKTEFFLQLQARKEMEKGG